LTSDAATWRHNASFSITHGPAIKNRRPGELRFFQMAALLNTRKVLAAAAAKVNQMCFGCQPRGFGAL
jgi:hypothetical protein